MKHYIWILLFSVVYATGQIHNPTKWTFDVRPLSGNEQELLLTCSLENGWHLYSQHLDDGGPIPTEFTFEDNTNYELISNTQEPDPEKEYDPNFDMQLAYFSHQAIFRQKIKVLSTDTFSIKGNIYFMVCDSTMCLPPEEISFLIPIDNKEDSDTGDSNGICWGIFWAGLLGGLLALLTPCVFPMIPLTVSFFIKQSKSKSKGFINAIIYSISIIGIYVILGMGVAIFFGADALNALSTNVWFNFFFFILLVIFAISFLGAFEISLPSSWINKADEASNKGGLIGIFFMAFTLSLVSFSCTGPIIGTLLVEAAVTGSYICPMLGMTGFALALALPFGLFAAFPGWLNSLPKSGGWLNTVKVVLGFLELALALKFLSNADLVIQAGILTREIFLALWIAIFAMLSVYLFGFIHFSHDSKMTHLPIPRALLGILTLTFTIYLIPGLWGAPLKIISGFPPPMFYSESPNGLSKNVMSAKDNLDEANNNTHCPHSLNCFHDYEEGMAYAMKIDKPIILDFTGWACVNCRKMEEEVWSQPEVLSLLSNDYVLISLYVDEQTALPIEDQYVSEITGKKIKTIGNKWSDFQISRFNTNAQPWYVLTDHEGKELNSPLGYTPDINKFKEFLKFGIKEYKKR